MGYNTNFSGHFLITTLKKDLQDEYDNFIEQARHENNLSYCQWVLEYLHPQDNVHYYTLKWDEGEKFYDYVEWLEYLIETHFKNCTVFGEVYFSGEDVKDSGIIKINPVGLSVAVYSIEDLVFLAKI